MVQSLPGFLDLCLNVCSPSQVLGDVYTEVLEAAHPLHRGPADHKRSVGPLLSLPEVYNQLFSFAHVQRETVVGNHPRHYRDNFLKDNKGKTETLIEFSHALMALLEKLKCCNPRGVSEDVMLRDQLAENVRNKVLCREL